MKSSGIQPPSELVDALDTARRLVCIGHVNPDADCLGAMLSIARVWGREDNRTASVALPEKSLSKRLMFMAEWGKVPLASVDDVLSADTIIVADTAKPIRCNVPDGLAENWLENRTVLNIDHHVTNNRFGTVNWVVASAASTSEMVFSLLRGANKAIDATTASLLYAGIYTDTVGFSVSSTSGNTLRAAAELVDLGARVGSLCERIGRSQRPEEFRLTRLFYKNTKLSEDGLIAYSKAGYDEILSTGCGPEDIDNQVHIPRSMDGIKIAILFTEGPKGRTRINFRGEQNTRVLELAQRFGGGGHNEAAGTTLNCPVDEAVAKVIPAATEIVNKQSG